MVDKYLKTAKNMTMFDDISQKYKFNVFFILTVEMAV